MPLKDFLIYLAIGRLLTWTLQTNGLLRPVWRLKPILAELGECDLCLGFWVYLILGYFSGLRLGAWPYWLDLVILALATSLMAHLLRLGWLTKFGVTVIE